MWNADYYAEGCPASSFITLHLDASEKTKTPIEMTWSDGGIRPYHPDTIPADNDIGGPDSCNGVLISGEKVLSPQILMTVVLYHQSSI